MKTIISTTFGVALLGLVACGPSAEQVEQQRQDSIRVADSIQASIVAAEVEAMRIQDSIAVAEAATKTDTVAVQ